MMMERPETSSTGLARVEINPSSPEFEALRNRLMSEIEAKLSQKEESLWRRGQVEIRKLQLETAQVTSCVSKLQERQATLVSENQKMRGALLEVTSKFELVVTEMREALRALPQRSGEADLLSPSPSVASTSASDAVAKDEPSPTPGSSVG